MRKFFLALFAAFTLLAITSCANKDRENILKVYNWADYIDEDLLTEFEDWYYEQTGKEVEVIYQLFDINEVMLSKIELGNEDYDVVCPSEYIIERMLRKDLLIPIDKDFGDTPNYIDANLSPFIVETFNKIDGGGKNANDYAVGYMWGTTGFLYNTKYVTKEEVSTWGVLSDSKYSGKIFVKDAFRDVYSPYLIYLKQDEINAGEVTLEELMYDSSDESIALVENYLKSVKDNIAGWEADFGKELMTKEKAYINLTWSGDAAWAIEEAELVDCYLDYTIPQEGSIVWFDGWVIPKYAVNVDAARYFINFMCMPENAVRNMDEIGYVSAIGGQEILDAMSDESYEPRDVSYFFGEGAESVRLNPVMYPSTEEVAKCAMMHDSGDRTEYMLAMWTRIKGDNATAFSFILISVAILLFFVMGVRRRILKNKKKRRF